MGQSQDQQKSRLERYEDVARNLELFVVSLNGNAPPTPCVWPTDRLYVLELWANRLKGDWERQKEKERLRPLVQEIIAEMPESEADKVLKTGLDALLEKARAMQEKDVDAVPKPVVE